MKEEEFFDDDEEVSAAAPARKHLSTTRTLLLVSLGLGLLWFAYPLRDEIAYNFSGQEIVDLGDITGLGELPPPETYVRITAVLGNKAATITEGFRPGTWRRGPIQFRQTLGGPFFLEFDEEKHKEKYGAFSTGSVGVAQVTVEGRLVAMPKGGDLDVVRDYFRARYRKAIPDNARVLIVDEAPGSLTTVSLIAGGMIALGLLCLLWVARDLALRLIKR